MATVVTFNGKQLFRVDDPDTHELKYYKARGETNYYFPNNGSFIVLTEPQYDSFTIENMKRRRKGDRLLSVVEYYTTIASEPVGGRKKRRSATKSRPRRSTRSRKVTLRRR